MASQYSVYQQLVNAGIEVAHLESDLFVKLTEESCEIVRVYPHIQNVKRFINPTDHAWWFKIPLAYDPWFELRTH